MKILGLRLCPFCYRPDQGYFQTGCGLERCADYRPWYCTADRRASILTDNWTLCHYMTTCTAMSAAPTSPASGNQNYGDWLSFQGTSIEVINDYYYGYMHQLMAKMPGLPAIHRRKRNTPEIQAIKRKFLDPCHIDNGNLSIKSKEGNVPPIYELDRQKGVWENNSQPPCCGSQAGFYDSDEMRDAAESNGKKAKISVIVK